MSDVNIKEALDTPSRLPLSTILGGLSGLVYVSGYLVHSFFVRSKGIHTLPLVNAEYIHAGLVFVCLTTFIVAVPVLLWWIVIEGRRRSNSRINSTVWVTPFVATNYLYLVVFFALFITRPDWEYRITVQSTTFPLSVAVLAYFIVTAGLLVLSPAIRHFNFSTDLNNSRLFTNGIDRTKRSRIFRVMVAGIRLIAVLMTVLFDCLLWTKLPWFAPFMRRMVLFALSLVIIVLAIQIVLKWAEAYRLSGSRNVFAYMSAPFFVAFYLVLISTYTYGVYKTLPINRGGRYPLATVTLTMSPNAFLSSNLIESSNERAIVSTPVYIMEDSKDFLYLLPDRKPMDWFGETPPFVGVRKENVLRIDFSPTRDGRPRM